MDIAGEIESKGFAIVPAVFETSILQSLIDALDGVSDPAVHQRGDKKATYAIRNLLSLVPHVRELALSKKMLELIRPLCGAAAVPVQGLLLDKTAEANWKVFWHQDTTIPVKARREVPGFKHWSDKAGVPHVDAPAEILGTMLVARIHLDDCSEDNGPLQVLPGSHAHGVLSPDAIQSMRRSVTPVTCLVPAGSVLLMRPLLVHASSPSQQARHRRVIHLEYASTPLPGGLEFP